MRDSDEPWNAFGGVFFCDRDLNFYVKPVLTAGANYGVLTLFLRQTKVVSAGRTFFVHVGFLVSLFAFLKLDKLLRLVK